MLVIPWMVDYAASLLSRFNRGSDGLTPYERSTGKKWRLKVPEFAETVWFQPLKGERKRGKLEPKFEEGIFLGIQEGSAMKWIGTGEGVQRCWTIKCKAGADRWDQTLMQMLIGLPWQLKPRIDAAERAVPMPAAVVIDVPVLPLEDVKDKDREERKKPFRPRGIYIRRNVELEAYGFTPGCDGCEAARNGLSHKQHSLGCKQRIREEMMKDEAGRRKAAAADARANEFLEKSKKAQEEAQEKKRKAEEDSKQEQGKQARVEEALALEDIRPVGQEGIASGSNAMEAGEPDTPLPAEEPLVGGLMAMLTPRWAKKFSPAPWSLDPWML